MIQLTVVKPAGPDNLEEVRRDAYVHPHHVVAVHESMDKVGYTVVYISSSSVPLLVVEKPDDIFRQVTSSRMAGTAKSW